MATYKEHNAEKDKLLRSALPIGTVLKGNGAAHEYKVVDVLGAGGFGITYKVSTLIKVGNVTTKMFFVIKEHFFKGCDRKEDKKEVSCATNLKEDFILSREDFIVEAERLNKLGNLSPNIVKVNENFEANNTAYYVMEYLDGPDLSDLIKKNGRMAETKAISIITPIAKAVELLHNDHVLHLDIKPENIVMKTDASTGVKTPVLIDFGISKHFDKRGRPTSSLVAKGASDGFAPIEQYTEITTFAPEIDVYALGATLYFLLTGMRPKKAFYETTENITNTLPANISARTRSAIVNSMQRGPAERTKDVKTFLAALERSSTLPLGSILHGATTNYQIVDVIMQSEDYIQYRAIQTSSERAQTNDTPVFQKYYVYEWFEKDIDKRREDLSRQSESNNTLTNTSRWLTHIKSIIGRNDLVGELSIQTGGDYSQNECNLQLGKDEKIKSELMYCNDTLYLACVISQKPSIWKNQAVAVIAGFVVVVGLGFYGIHWYINRTQPTKAELISEVVKDNDKPEVPTIDTVKPPVNNPVPVKVESKKVNVSQEKAPVSKKENAESPKEIDINTALRTNNWTALQELATSGNARAYAPLAEHYLKTNNYSSADSYAQRAWNSGTDRARAKNVMEFLKISGYYDDKVVPNAVK